MPAKKARSPRPTLTRESVLAAALVLADHHGLDALSMRKLGQALGVEAMSLYNHVANKDDVLDGMVDLVMGEIHVPVGRPWRDALRERSISAHDVLLAHPWAAALIESRLSPGPQRLAHHNALIGVLREADFPMDLAYRAFLTLDSYIYGFILQEVNWPFTRAERPDVVTAIEPMVTMEAHPHLIAMMSYVMDSSREELAAEGAGGAYRAEFEFGLDLILDGLAAALGARR
ncbi:MAG: TetR/AcrR family transcriptional regulator C-terminal domain-containing protein [Myxococcales bacterium]|nr:TetR/AcrR family transcriptional regulator C-terminal domain-containing protein [Myxococcales bacterium]MCB9630027.1 TetR/AcrR family transcriptional regulator C-terminal domain-containing protein [Sandaracinaceae bacterium]